MDMFDTAHNRLSYSELLQPELGYKLDFAVGLTYSLDLEALLGIPVSLGLLDEADSELMRSPFYLLEAIRKSSDNLAIFCNAGGIALPRKIQSVFSLLENSVFEIKLSNKQNFHPKLWFIKYTNEDGHSYIKLLVLSRNLTFDNSIDLCVAMQGKITRVKRNKNRPLADMLTFVSGYASKTKKQKIAELAEDILHVMAFELEHPFENYEFLPLGITVYDKENTRLFNSKYDIFIVSPFLSDDIISELSRCPYNKVLVTRKASVSPLAINSFDSVYITKDILKDNEFGIKQDIHAKLYFTITNEGNFLYIGSANASHNAFHKNVEFLLKLKYKPNCVGFKTFFNDFIPDENCPYEKIETAPEMLPADAVQASIDKAFKEAVYALKGAKVFANGDVYDIQVEAKGLKTEETVKIAPFQRQDLLQPLQTQTLLKGMLLRELSEFYIISVQDQKIVIKIDTKGIPVERDSSIYKSIINTRTKFLSYLSFMLSENYTAAALEDSEYMHLMQGGEEELSNAPVYAAVYEKMLKVIHQNPARLKEVADVIRRLDQDIVGDEFLEMYKHFELAARRLRK
jgi:hypothetical protein